MDSIGKRLTGTDESTGGATAKAKKRNKKKKGGGSKVDTKADQQSGNGQNSVHPDDADEDTNEDGLTVSPMCTCFAGCTDTPQPTSESPSKEEFPDPPDTATASLKSNGIHADQSKSAKSAKSVAEAGSPGQRDAEDSTSIYAKLEALTKEREILLREVAEMRKSLEVIRGAQDTETTDLLEQVKQAELEKEEAVAAQEKAETQYQELLGRVNTIRTNLGERLKADAVGSCLESLNAAF
jgi:hypothetical protein